MKTNNWNNNQTKLLFKAFLTLKNSDEVAAFCRDLMTQAEIAEFTSRLEVAQALYNGATQRQAAKDTGASIATVTRVNQWLTRGMDGYQTVLKRLALDSHHHNDNILASGSE